MTSRELSFEVVSKLFYYDESSPTYLRWNQARRCASRILVVKGDVAGHRSKRGYITVPIDGKTIAAHRVVMILHGFDVTGLHVDHKDRDKSNNKISNLRVVPKILNDRNHGIRAHNASGVTGVKWDREGTRLRTVAFWQEGGRSVCKTFAVSKYGLLPAFALAVKARNEAIASLNEKGYGYSENHGRS